MSIQNTHRVCGPYACNGLTTQFPFDFKIFSNEQVTAVLGDARDRETVLTFGTDYSVTLNADQDNHPGGTVILHTAYTKDYRVAVISNVPNIQPDTLINQGGFYPKVIERALDRLQAQIQQINSTAQRAVRVPVFSNTKPDDLLQELKADARAAAAANNEAHEWADRALSHSQDANASQIAAQASRDLADKSAASAWNSLQAMTGLPVYSFNALPTKNVGMIIVREFGEMWHWVQWAKFTGYRSKNCGQIGYFHALDPQPGWLKANGAAVSRTYYAGLNSMLDGQYGYTEDGEKFYLPDHRGEFIRGYDDGRGVDPGHLLGTTQAATAIRALLDNYCEPPGVPYPAGTLAVGMRNTDGRLLGAGSDTTVGDISTYYRVGNVLPLAGWEDNRGYFTRPRNFALSAFIKF